MAGHEKKQQQEEESGESAPLWIVSFADMISLLMAFFVMLTTFASFGPGDSEIIRGINKIALKPNYGIFSRPPRKSIIQNRIASQAEAGSEKPTLEEKSGGGGVNDNDLQDFRKRRVFLVESRTAFVANTATLSPQGREFLSTLAVFVKEVPARVVVSESGNDNNVDFGIARSMSVIKYLVEKGLSADICNVGAAGMSPSENFAKTRMLEIVLLDERMAK